MWAADEEPGFILPDTLNDGEAAVGPATSPVSVTDHEEAVPGGGEDPRGRAADTRNDWEAVVGPIASPVPGADQEKTAPSPEEAGHDELLIGSGRGPAHSQWVHCPRF